MNKIEGRNLKDRDALLRAFRIFFKMGVDDGDSLKGQKYVLQCFLIELELLRKWFHENRSFAFYASSLLLIYEGDDAAITHSRGFDCINLKMIDFAHVRKHRGLDVGFLHGIDNIVSIFKELLYSS